MAAKQILNNTAVYVQQWIGTYAEMAGVTTTTLAPGSTYWATDTKAGYVWDGSAWQAV